MNSERFTNTAQFIHNNITKHTISHAKNIMADIADCAKSIKNMGKNNGADEMQQLLQLTENAAINNKSITTTLKIAPHTNVERLDGIAHSLPRANTMQPLEDTDRRLTRSMMKDNPLVTRVSPTSFPRVEKTPKVVQGDLPLNHQITKKNKIHRRRQAQDIPTVSYSAPSRNTRFRTIAVAPADIKKKTSTRASTRLSQLMRLTPSTRNKTTQTEHAEAVEEHLNLKKLGWMTRRISNLENKVHQAMAVMDEETGKMLNYEQLMQDTKYKKHWSTSSAN